VPPWAAFSPRTRQSIAIAMSKGISDAQASQFKPPWRAPFAVEVHQGGDAAVSCRLCLIACNLRKFTFPPGLAAFSTTEEGNSGDR
jgi:hypothetical protein